MSSYLNPSLALKESIRTLERQKAIDEDLLREEFNLAIENLNPINLIKNTFKSAVADSDDIKTDLIETGIGLVAGYFVKKIIVGDSNKGLQKLIGNTVQTLLTVLITKNYGKLKFIFDTIYNAISPDKEEDEDEQ